MKFFYLVAISVFIFSYSSQSFCQESIVVDLRDELISPRHYIISKTNETMVIDGRADEESWQNAPNSTLFIDIEGIKIPKFDTYFKMLWDSKYLYIYAKMEEPHVWGDITERDAIIYLNNDFEVFIDPSGDTFNYAEIEINALGTVWDLLLDRSYRVGGKGHNYWNLNKMKSAISIEGTLNNPTDIDSLWTVEMAIPMQALVSLRNRRALPKEGEQWRMNFSRVEWDFAIDNKKYDRKKDRGEYAKEYNWVWSSQKVVNMHEPEKWGIVQFTNKPSSENIDFINIKNEKTIQIAYALFRHGRFGRLQYLSEEPTGYEQNIEILLPNTEVTKAKFYKTNFGFEFKMEDATTRKVVIINEMGMLKIIE